MNIKTVINSVYVDIQDKLLWETYYKSLRSPKVKSYIPNQSTHGELIKELKANDFKLTNFKIDLDDYNEYLNKTADIYRKHNYYDVKYKKTIEFAEKTLEHYLAAKILNLSKEDIYIDIASAYSPTSEIYRKLYGCKTYKQDLIYPEGIHGDIIGGDASNLPIKDDFFDKMALHCSFEHFEGNSDIKFIEETSRVLKKGGKLCILPLYLFNQYAVQTDPVLAKEGIIFDKEAILYCARGWKNRHARFYDVKHLIKRIKRNLNDLKLTIFVLENEKEVNPSCYIKFIAFFEKR